MEKAEVINQSVQVPREKLERYKKVKKGFNIAKAGVGIVGGVATVVCIACPMDGPVGDIVALCATGGLLAIVNATEKIYDNIVDIPNENTDISKNFDEIAKNTQVAASEIQKFKNAAQTQTNQGGPRR